MSVALGWPWKILHSHGKLCIVARMPQPSTAGKSTWNAVRNQKGLTSGNHVIWGQILLSGLFVEIMQLWASLYMMHLAHRLLFSTRFPKKTHWHGTIASPSETIRASCSQSRTSTVDRQCTPLKGSPCSRNALAPVSMFLFATCCIQSISSSTDWTCWRQSEPGLRCMRGWRRTDNQSHGWGLRWHNGQELSQDLNRAQLQKNTTQAPNQPHLARC